MSLFERYLTLWVFLCIVAGVLLGQWFPGVFAAVSAMEVANVNLPVAVLIWLMIYPMMLKIDLASVLEVRRRPRGILVTLVGNPLVSLELTTVNEELDDDDVEAMFDAMIERLEEG